MADEYISQITLPNNDTYTFKDLNLKVYSGICETAASTAIKEVTCSNSFVLEKGAVIFVTFANTNSATAANLKLRINSDADSDAKPIKHEYNASEANLPGNGYLRANQTYQFHYDGTNWVTDVGRDANSTYSYMRPYETTAKGSYSTTGANPAKTATGGWKFSLDAGKYFAYSQQYNNTAQSALTLNIASTGAKPIYINGEPSSATNHTLPSGQYIVYYDGTNYHFRTDNKLPGNVAGDAATVNGLTVETAVPQNAVFTDHYAWSEITGKPTKITLTGSVTGSVTLGAGDLTLETTTNHNHNSSYVTAVGYDSTNKKIYYTKNGSNTDVVTFGSNAFNSTSYLPLAGGIMTGNIRRYYSTTSTEPLLTALANNADIIFWEVGHGTEAATNISSANHYSLKYVGSGTSPNNYLQLLANTSSTQVIAAQWDENGNATYNGEAHFNLGTSNTSSNNRKFTIQGVDNNKMSIAPTGIQVYNSSNAVTTMYLQAYGGNLIIGASSYATATRDMYGVFDFKSSTGFNYSGIGAGSDNVARNIWFSYNGKRGTPVYDDDFKYNPSTNVLTIGKLTVTGGTTDSSISSSGALTISNTGSSKAITIDSNYTLYLNSAASTSIIFTKSGADTNHELARFDINGNFVPKASSSYTIGTSSNKWSAIYATTFNGSGSGLTSLPAGQLTGTVPTSCYTNTTYTFAGGDGSFTVTPSGGSAQTVSIGKPSTAGTADKLGTDAGSSTVPVYFSNGIPVAISTHTAPYTKELQIDGDKDTYYPVVISLTGDKTKPHIISIWKNLGSTTNPDYPGNHSNKSSSLWLMYECRSNPWDGNGGYCKSLYCYQGYATLIAKAQSLGNAAGKLGLWLRGGGTKYWFSADHNLNVNVYYERSNIVNEQYPLWVEPTTEVTSNGWRLYGAPYYGNLTGNAASATRANISSTKWGIAYYSDTTGTFAGTGAGTSGQYLKSNGSSAPTWASLPEASSSTKGIVQIGSGITVNNGTISVSASNLGLSSALKFIGITTTDMTGGTASNHSYTGVPAGITNYTTPVQGDVVINNTNNDEWVCTIANGANSEWERLGSDTSYKIVQSAISNSTGSADGTNSSTSFIYSFSQTANGNITDIKTRKLPEASSSTKGIVLLGAANGAATYGHTHGNITSAGLLENANCLVWTDSDKKVYAGYHYASSTKVAINSSSEPTQNFYVGGGAEITGPLRITATSGSKRILLGNQDSSGANCPVILEAANGTLYIGNGSSWSGSGSTLSTALFMTKDRKIGIGTTSPTSLLQVNGIITVYKADTTANDAPAQITFTNKDTTTGGSSSATIKVYNDHSATSYGTNMVINTNGTLIIGGGEAPDALYTAIKSSIGTNENTYIISDGSNFLYANAQNGAGNRIGIQINTSGHLIPQKADAKNNNQQNLGASDNKWANLYVTTAYATTLDSSVLKLHQGTAANPSTSSNARISFDYSTGSQPVHIAYTPNDSYRAPAGLKIIGNGTTSGSEPSSPAWLEVEGAIYGASFNGSASGLTSIPAGQLTGTIPSSCYSHTHTLSIEEDSGTSNVNTLSENTTYKLTAGDNSILIKTPADTHNNLVSQTLKSDNVEYKLLATNASADGNNGAVFNSDIKLNPNTGTITATIFNGRATYTGKGTHSAAVTANEFTPPVGTLTLVGNVSNTTMPKTNNANAEMIIKAHPTTSGSHYYEARLGFSSNGGLYYMPVDSSNWKKLAYLSDIEALDVSNISGFGANKTLKTLTETDGKIAATFQDISITESQISDFGSYSLSGHTHNYAGSSSAGGAATTALKLNSSVTIWGKTFDGSANIDGNMTLTQTESENLVLDMKSTHTNVNRDCSIRIGASSRRFGIYDHDNTKWILYAESDGTNVFNGNAATATSADTASALDYVSKINNSNNENLLTSNGKMRLYVHANNDRPTHSPTDSYNAGIFILPSGRANDTFQIEYSCNSQRLYTRAWLNTPSEFPSWNKIAFVSDIPTKVSQLTNDSNFTTNTGTVTKVSTGVGLTGGDVTTTGTIKANLTSETKLANAATAATEDANRIYAVRIDKNDKLAVVVPWTDHYAWADITGKPVEFITNSSALNSNGWKTLGGRSSGSKIAISYASSSPATWNSQSYSATIVFGCSDTKGFLDCGYNSAIVTFGGGSVGGSTDNAPKWYFKFSGTSEKTYTLPGDSKTLCAADGSNASGTEWGISITGSSASCTGNAATASKIAAKLATTTKTFLLGTSTTITETAANVDLIGDTGVYLTTTAGQLSAKSYYINDGTNEKVRMEWNSTDLSLDFIFA